MQIIFTSKFDKDIQHIDSSPLKKELIQVIEEIEKIENIVELKNVKKNERAKDAYRIRIGDYRSVSI